MNLTRNYEEKTGVDTEMSKAKHDIVAIIAADIKSPQVFRRIDDALETLEQQRQELLSLQKTAARIHGGKVAASGRRKVTYAASESENKPTSNLTLADLIHRYRTDKRSPYHGLRHRTREYYDTLIRRLGEECGKEKPAELKAQDIQRFYDGWIEGNKLTMGHALITMLRALATFGTTILNNEQCERLSFVLHNMRFSTLEMKKQSAARKEPLTIEHVKKIIARAHEVKRPSIALAQAFQFDCRLGQKEVIGEWVPMKEPGTSDVISGKEKWLHGLRWSEIDKDLILRHTMSRGGRLMEKRLTEAPLVMAEFARLGTLPKTGPIVLSEHDKLPWTAFEFRRWWRKIARECDIPDAVRNMYSKAAANPETSNERAGSRA